MRARFALLWLLPVLALGQSTTPKGPGRKMLVTGAVRTVPRGGRFALGTRLGTFSVAASEAKIFNGWRVGRISDLRFGSSVTVLGTLTPATSIGRATIVATRIEIARPVATVAKAPSGTSKPRPALKRP